MSSEPTRILLVEGANDFHLIQHVLGKHGITAKRQQGNVRTDSQTIYIEPMNGKDELANFLQIYLQKGGLERLGIILDADQDYGQAFRSYWDQIENQFPEDVFLDQDNLHEIRGAPIRAVVGYGRPKSIGLWIMPDNEGNGAIENFASQLIPAPDILWPIAEQTVENLPEKRFQTESNSRIHKAKIHTWLAWQEKPGPPFGTAVRAGYLDAHAPLALDFVGWINALLFSQLPPTSQP